ncbi:Isoleucine--tRNA ligase [Camellia lanceoleosa]|uniref:Isoleucine--tRNA ligase n=1 Tax=Camellia lanceoleosa TaxID=1840588 RepID=A0ACC0HX88_9ERIC|nr:Isoleucine--tRNA ligase [Camellia lanceoleosa]
MRQLTGANWHDLMMWCVLEVRSLSSQIGSQNPIEGSVRKTTSITLLYFRRSSSVKVFSLLNLACYILLVLVASFVLHQSEDLEYLLWQRRKHLKSWDHDARKELTPLKLRTKAAKFMKATIKTHVASFKRFGGWGDWDHPHLTLDLDYEAAQKWKCTPIGNYEKLAEIYGKDRATGVGAETAKEKVQRWANSSNNDHVDRIEVIDELVHQNEANLESFIVDEDDVVLSLKSGTSSKAKKRKLSNDSERDVDILKTTLQDIASAIREGNASMEKSQGCFSRGELHKVLEEIGIAPHLFTEAYFFLTKKFERMMQFFGCPMEYRKETLERMMYDTENRWMHGGGGFPSFRLRGVSALDVRVGDELNGRHLHRTG